MAGEASGEFYGALLAARLRELDPALRLFGMGGDQMERAGVELIHHIRHASQAGLVEVFRSIPRLLKIQRDLARAARERHADASVLIDFPDFNLVLAGALKRRGIPVVYYIGPTVWAWRAGRIRKVRRRTDRMLSIFPFEEPLYRKAGVNVTYVGHPLMSVLRAESDAAEFRKAHRLAGCDRVVGLLPGSRPSEIRYHMPVLVETVRRLHALRPGLGFLLALAPGLPRESVDVFFQGGAPRVSIVESDTPNAVHASDALVVSSGTATLECALLGRPFVSVYRLSPVTFRIARRFMNVNDYCIVNLILGRRVVTELIQDAFTPDAAVAEVLALLEDGERCARMIEAFGALRSILGESNGTDNAARAVLDMLDGQRAKPAEAPPPSTHRGLNAGEGGRMS